MSINLEELTLKQIREIATLVSAPQQMAAIQCSHPLLGKNCIVRTVTMIYTGKLVEVTPTDFVLVDCSWIPETDRFMQFVSEGKVRECEPYPEGLPVYVNRGALMDMCELKKELPRSQK